MRHQKAMHFVPCFKVFGYHLDEKIYTFYWLVAFANLWSCKRSKNSIYLYEILVIFLRRLEHEATANMRWPLTPYLDSRKKSYSSSKLYFLIVFGNIVLVNSSQHNFPPTLWLSRRVNSRNRKKLLKWRQLNVSN
jgi:hypothetical protein